MVWIGKKMCKPIAKIRPILCRQRAMEGAYIMVISCPEAPSRHALIHQEHSTSESFLWFLIALDGDFKRADTKLEIGSDFRDD